MSWYLSLRHLNPRSSGRGRLFSSLLDPLPLDQPLNYPEYGP